MMALCRDDLPLYVLAGGASSRFGSDKALAMHRGRPMLLQLIDALSSGVSGAVVVADRADRYDSFGVIGVADTRPGQGPLAGLESALQHRIRSIGSGWIALAACDLVDPEPGWLERLCVSVHAEAQAVAYRTDVWEPMLALYHSSILQTVQQRLDQGDRSMQRLLDRVVTVSLRLPDGMARLPQANTPAVLAGYHAMNGEHA